MGAFERVLDGMQVGTLQDDVCGVLQIEGNLE